jgi:hypothetical protein
VVVAQTNRQISRKAKVKRQKAKGKKESQSTRELYPVDIPENFFSGASSFLTRLRTKSRAKKCR